MKMKIRGISKCGLGIWEFGMRKSKIGKGPKEEHFFTAEAQRARRMAPAACFAKVWPPKSWSPYITPDLCGFPAGDGGLGFRKRVRESLRLGRADGLHRPIDFFRFKITG